MGSILGYSWVPFWAIQLSCNNSEVAHTRASVTKE